MRKIAASEYTTVQVMLFSDLYINIVSYEIGYINKLILLRILGTLNNTSTIEMNRRLVLDLLS